MTTRVMSSGVRPSLARAGRSAPPSPSSGAAPLPVSRRIASPSTWTRTAWTGTVTWPSPASGRRPAQAAAGRSGNSSAVARVSSPSRIRAIRASPTVAVRRTRRFDISSALPWLVDVLVGRGHPAASTLPREADNTGQDYLQGQFLCGYQPRSEEHTSELQSRQYLVCRLLLEKKNITFHHWSCLNIA